MPARPDRPLVVILPADDPEAAAGDANLVEALAEGRQQVAVWQGDGGGRPKIVVLLGPVPVAPVVEAPVVEVPPVPVPTSAWSVRVHPSVAGLAVGSAGAGFILLVGWIGKLLAG